MCSGIRPRRTVNGLREDRVCGWRGGLGRRTEAAPGLRTKMSESGAHVVNGHIINPRYRLGPLFACSGPSPEESVVVASGLAQLLAIMGKVLGEKLEAHRLKEVAAIGSGIRPADVEWAAGGRVCRWRGDPGRRAETTSGPRTNRRKRGACGEWGHS
jgi:hypothetical protein